LSEREIEIQKLLAGLWTPIAMADLARIAEISWGRTLGYLEDLENLGYVEKIGPKYSITDEGKTFYRIIRQIPEGMEFQFYTDINKHTGLSARSIKDFIEFIWIIDEEALKFHLYRGDFEQWFINIFNEKDLADDIVKINKKETDSEVIRKKLLSILEKKFGKYIDKTSDES
jgi:hypothetical protein